VTIQTIKTVEVGEEALKSRGFRQFRVAPLHGELLRIEVGARRRSCHQCRLNMDMAASLDGRISGSLDSSYFTLTRQWGYRQGSLNEVLNLGARLDAACSRRFSRTGNCRFLRGAR